MIGALRQSPAVNRFVRNPLSVLGLVLVLTIVILAVGADVLYAPGLRTIDEMRTVIAAVGKPVNIVMGFADPSITLSQLAEIGVRRVSIGGAFSRLALQSMLRAAREMKDGRFAFVEDVIPIKELRHAFRQ